MNVAEFIAKWRKVELKERSAAQEHFLDLCHLVGHPTPAEADPTGADFCFEKGAAKHGGGDGFADVWKRLFYGWEYKGKHKDLEAAFDQLLLYKDALDNPPLLVVCDMDRIVIRTNFTGTAPVTYEIPLEKLGEPRNLEILHNVFFDPEKLKPGKTSEAITQDAADHFATIADSMRARNLDSGRVAHFLDRVVFCLFAEDIGLLPDMIFSRIVEKSAGDPQRFGKLIGQLFETMAHGGDFGMENIRHFNGNLFDDRSVLDLTPDEVSRIAAAARLDWSAVEPHILATLGTNACDAYNRGEDEKAVKLATEYVARYEEAMGQAGKAFGLVNAAWDQNCAVMHSILAENAMSNSEYEQALKHIDRARKLAQTVVNDVIKAQILILKHDQEGFCQLSMVYRQRPADAREEFFRTLIKNGYMLPVRVDDASIDALKQVCGITGKIEFPPAMRVSAPAGGTNVISSAPFYLRQIGMGKSIPVSYEDESVLTNGVTLKPK